MKNKFLTFILIGGIFSTQLFSKSYIISPLPLPKQEVIDTTPNNCNEKCLQKLYNDGKIFSFVAKFKNDTQNIQLRANLAVALSQIDSFMQSSVYQNTLKTTGIKIALLVPKKIVGRYSVATIDTILAYLMTRGVNFDFKVFDSIDEDSENLNQTYNKIEQEHYNFVIAILTQDGVKNFVQSTYITRPTYIPTINKNQLNDIKLPNNLYFGGIDYTAQMKALLTIAKDSPIVEYDDDSTVGSTLGNILYNLDSGNIIFRDVVSSKQAATFSQNLKNQKEFLKDNIVILNTPVVKSGLMLSQMGFLEEPPSKILSTQINYSPSLLMLVQPKDRQNLYVMNSIGNTNQKLIEYGSLLSSDLRYDWVNYSTAIGVEMFFDMQNPKIDKYFSELISNHQVEYDNILYKASDGVFQQIK